MQIQLDMFAVELGAAILLQFRTGDDVVRVLADGGEARHDVNARLWPAVQHFDDEADERVHIDLLIGTHYDADHLAGLVAIIEDEGVTIGEAWLPPVANDTVLRPEHVAPQDGDLLPLQLAGEDGEAVLDRYLQRKAAICMRLAEAERAGDGLRGVERPDRVLPMIDRLWRAERPADEAPLPGGDFFHRHLADANRTLGLGEYRHADEQIRSPWDDDDLPSSRSIIGFAVLPTIETMAESWADARPARADVEASSLALIRKSTAKDAINAKALAKVVTALKARAVPIACRTIADGEPRRFIWRSNTRRFTPSARLPSDGPELLLLGPSDGLVKKHWQKLPVGDYAARVAFAPLPIEPITESNQLSYILRIDFAGQRLLVSGDAGCVDFKPKRGDYFPDLIAALSPLHVIQVAHHAGHNAHFYRCLVAAGYAAQDDRSYLLLSHKTNDPSRPSDVFAKFIEQVRSEGDDVQLLFTSQPLEAKVRDYKTLFAPVAGTAGTSGDVRLRFDDAGWSILTHAVAAP